MDSKLTKRAVKKLELKDIVLDSSSLLRNSEIDPLLYPYRVTKESSLSVKAEELSFLDEHNEEICILRTYICFSVKGIYNDTQDSDKESFKELFNISATYRVDYTILKKLTDDEIKEFSAYNAVHNAWPFWRQHVYNLVNNAKLPTISIPFFRETQPQKKKKTKAKIKAKK